MKTGREGLAFMAKRKWDVVDSVVYTQRNYKQVWMVEKIIHFELATASSQYAIAKTQSPDKSRKVCAYPLTSQCFFYRGCFEIAWWQQCHRH